METPTEVEFNDITLWVQCHNVPLECMNPSIIKRIGGQVGKVEEIDVDEGGGCVGKFARVRVTRPISDPLVRCVPLKQEGLEKEVIVILQYERLPDFCFSCGRVGHISRDCRDDSNDSKAPRFDSWLRAGRSFVGKREMEVGDRGGSRINMSGGSGSRWVAARSEARGEFGGSEKEALFSEGNRGKRGPDNNGEVSEGVEVSSVAATPDVCMLDRAVTVRVSEVGGGDRQTSRAEGVDLLDVGGSGEAVVLEKRKGKSTLMSKVTPSKVKVGAKKWKRLAREQKGDAEGRAEGGGGGSVLSGRMKRRDIMLRDEDEEEEENHRRKLLKGAGSDRGDVPTAAAAAQPRRSL